MLWMVHKSDCFKERKDEDGEGNEKSKKIFKIESMVFQRCD